MVLYHALHEHAVATLSEFSTLNAAGRHHHQLVAALLRLSVVEYK